MTDAAFLTELRDWADQAREAFDFQAEIAWHAGEHRAAEVANVAARTFADLRTICGRQVASERARLVENLMVAENKRIAIAQEHGDWTLIAHYHDEVLEKAHSALAEFDAATKGGE